MIAHGLKVCTVCRIEKPILDFNKNKSKKDGIGVVCKPCNKEVSKRYYLANKTRHKAATYERKRKNVRALKQYIYSLLKEKGCIDCSEHDPLVLEFDHVRGIKKSNISKMVQDGCAFASLQDELQKCVIRCANCHRRKTARDQNWYADLNLT